MFNNVDKAFEPFYNDVYAVRTKDGNTTFLKVCKFESMTDEPLSDEAMETERESITLSCRRVDWSFVTSTIQRGDELTDNRTLKKYRVVSVDDDYIMGLIIRARQS